jgi:hypothetical protein
MVTLLFAVLLQAPPQGPPAPELPFSLDRIREGLGQPRPLFEVPPPRPWNRPLFRVKIEEDRLRFEFTTDAWEDTGVVPPWVRPQRPTYHYEFLSLVTPEEVRGPTLHPCCNVTPLIEKVGQLISGGVRSVKKARARREVEKVMRDAGIKKD